MTPVRTPVRVAMVTAFALPELGGIETHVHEVSRRLGAAGVDVTVLTTDRSGRLPPVEESDGYRIRRWPAYPRARDYCLAPGIAAHLGSHRYDVVHVQGIRTLVLPLALGAAQRASTPSVLTLHTGGHRSVLRNSLRPMQYRAWTPLLRRASALVAVSEFERRTFAALFGLAEDRIRLIRNGSDPLPVDRCAGLPSGRPLIVSVGRLERFKGHHRILRAMPEILARAPQARLVIAGSGPYESRLRATAARLGLNDEVLIRSFGPEERGALGALIAEADVFCLLSDYEAHPIAVMEAVGAGTSALIADTSGLSELGRAGLARTIELNASSGQVAAAALATAAEPGPATAALPSWDDCAEQLHRLYFEVAA